MVLKLRPGTYTLYLLLRKMKEFLDNVVFQYQNKDRIACGWSRVPNFFDISNGMQSSSTFLSQLNKQFSLVLTVSCIVDLSEMKHIWYDPKYYILKSSLLHNIFLQIFCPIAGIIDITIFRGLTSVNNFVYCNHSNRL